MRHQHECDSQFSKNPNNMEFALLPLNNDAKKILFCFEEDKNETYASHITAYGSWNLEQQS